MHLELIYVKSSCVWLFVCILFRIGINVPSVWCIVVCNSKHFILFFQKSCVIVFILTVGCSNIKESWMGCLVKIPIEYHVNVPKVFGVHMFYVSQSVVNRIQEATSNQRCII
jgi:hypothetical protein